MTATIPNGFTQYDWMELLGFAHKVESEGYEYASENYAPAFESQALQTIAQDYEPALNAWQEKTGWEQVGELYNAHLREEKERKEAHLLWAVHPGGDWNYAAYSEAFATRADAERWIEGRDELVKKHGWKPWTGRLLHREAPGTAWVEVPQS